MEHSLVVRYTNGRGEETEDFDGDLASAKRLADTYRTEPYVDRVEVWHTETDTLQYTA
jgi:hypothetical protein